MSVVTSIRPHYDQVIGKLLSSEAITDLCNQAEYKQIENDCQSQGEEDCNLQTCYPPGASLKANTYRAQFWQGSLEFPHCINFCVVW